MNYTKKGLSLVLALVLSTSGLLGQDAQVKEGVKLEVVPLGTMSGKQMSRWASSAKKGAEQSPKQQFLARKKLARENFLKQQADALVQAQKSSVVEAVVEPAAQGVKYVPTVGLNFTPSGRINAATSPFGNVPDTGGGDVGPEQILYIQNSDVKTLDKATGAQDFVLDLDPSLFSATSGVTYPIALYTDPCTRFDRYSQRWFQVSITEHVGVTETNFIVIGVSDSAVISDTTTWQFYALAASQIPPASPVFTHIADFEKIGLDMNALYIGYQEFDNVDVNYVNSVAVVIQKESLLNGGPVVATAFRNLNTQPQDQSIEPGFCGVDNLDATENDPGFFFAYNGANGFPITNIVVYRIFNPGSTNPSISEPEFVPIPPVEGVFPPFFAPHKGNILGERGLLELLQVPTDGVIRNLHLFTAGDLPVDRFGQSNANPDREGIRWYEIDLTTTPASLVQSGTVFDPSPTNPLWYNFASLSVNKFGDIVMGSTVSGNDLFVSGVVFGRFKNDPVGLMSDPVIVAPGAASFNARFNVRWGDYSRVAVDPSDDTTFWSFQEYVPSQDNYGIAVTRLVRPTSAE